MRRWHLEPRCFSGRTCSCTATRSRRFSRAPTSISASSYGSASRRSPGTWPACRLGEITSSCMGHGVHVCTPMGSVGWAVVPGKRYCGLWPQDCYTRLVIGGSWESFACWSPRLTDPWLGYMYISWKDDVGGGASGTVLRRRGEGKILGRVNDFGWFGRIDGIVGDRGILIWWWTDGVLFHLARGAFHWRMNEWEKYFWTVDNVEVIGSPFLYVG